MSSSTLFRGDALGPVRPAEAQNHCCPVCMTVSRNKTFVAREMMFGLRDEFLYAECSHCGCVWLVDCPPELSRYYPADYYPAPPAMAAATGLRARLWHQRARSCLLDRGLFGRLLAMTFGRPTAGIFGRPDYYVWLKRAGVTFSSSILDVGCGGGALLMRLYNDGFSNLTGVDPFIEKSVRYASGFSILKQSLYEVEGQFDLIMLHHTFEHVPDPAEVLQHVSTLLRSDRYAVIRIPVASSFAYRKYGANWGQLDAPRHLFLHSFESVRILAEQAGLRVAEVLCDSDEFQFWASEQYHERYPAKRSPFTFCQSKRINF